MSETWKQIAEFPEYDVSDLGRVRSRDKRVAHFQGGTRLRPGRILAMRADKDGYRKVNLYRERKELRTRRICRLVALAFIGDPPTSEHQAAHLDGDNQHDCALNLEWKTGKENMADRERHGRTPRGETNGFSTQTAGSVERIRDLAVCGVRQIDIAAWIGLSQPQVSAIVRRERWSHVA